MGAAGEGEHVTSMVKNALALGYRHVDTVNGNLCGISAP